MRANGSIQYAIAAADSFNERGELIPAEGQGWSAPIACMISTITDSRKGVTEGGHFRAASFDILIDVSIEADFAELLMIKSSAVRLTRGGEPLGEFSIMRAERIATMGRWHIIV